MYEDLVGAEKALVIGPEEPGVQTATLSFPGELVWPEKTPVETEPEEEVVPLGPLALSVLDVACVTAWVGDVVEGVYTEGMPDWEPSAEEVTADCRMLPLAKRTPAMKTTEATPARTVRSFATKIYLYRDEGFWGRPEFKR